jgi:EpsI family protein
MTATMRSVVVTLLLLGTAAYLRVATHAEPVAVRESLDACPVMISNWSGQPAAPFDERTLGILGVDEYLNRIYVNGHGRPVGLYIGYYGSQREGSTMHSPLNCLPGAGWSPVRFNRVHIQVPPTPTDPAGAHEGTIQVNRYVIEKGLDRQLVLYWYQSQGRTIASEYWGKVYLVLDAIRRNRTDGALVRIVAPIVSSEDDAERDAVDFAKVLYPLLGRYLPS